MMKMRDTKSVRNRLCDDARLRPGDLQNRELAN